MGEFNGDLKKCFYFVLFAFFVQFNDAKLHSNQSNNSVDFNALDFEQIKYGLLQTGSKCSDSIYDQSCSCSSEISAIKNGVENIQDWALKRMY